MNTTQSKGYGKTNHVTGDQKKAMAPAERRRTRTWGTRSGVPIPLRSSSRGDLVEGLEKVNA